MDALENHPAVEIAAHRADPPVARLCDRASGVILLGLVVLTPWALGSTPSGAIAALNVAGYGLGGLLLAKWIARRTARGTAIVPGTRSCEGRETILGLLTLLLLLWCLISAANARPAAASADGFISWLPHSLAPASTWSAFWFYLGTAAVFWATRDWLGTNRPANHQDRTLEPAGETRPFPPPLPARLAWLLWLVGLNGGALALVAILQRVTDAEKLLWLFANPRGGDADSGFGPFPYRNNGAEYVNLIWPVCLGFWWTLHSASTATRRRSLVLLVATALMAASPIVATSRGGSLIALGLAFGSVLVFTAFGRHGWRRRARPVIGALTATIALAGWLGWPQLERRLFPPYEVLDTGHNWIGDFTLRCAFEAAPKRGAKLEGLVGLSDTDYIQVRRVWAPYLGINRDGSLRFALWDPRGKPLAVLTEPGFSTNYASGLVEVMVSRRGTNWSLHVNGVPAGKLLADPQRLAAVPAQLPARALWIGSLAGGSTFFAGKIRRVTILTNALPESAPAVPSARPERHDHFAAATLDDGTAFHPLIEVDLTRFDFARWWTRSLASRNSLRELARRWYAATPALLGGGPGTFPAVFAAQPDSPPGLADHQVHDDWLQTRLTFGWIGTGLIGVALLLSLAPLSRLRGAGARTVLGLQLLLAMVAILIHARFDFPLQNPAIFLLFVVFAAVASSEAPGWNAGSARPGRQLTVGTAESSGARRL